MGVEHTSAKGIKQILVPGIIVTDAAFCGGPGSVTINGLKPGNVVELSGGRRMTVAEGKHEVRFENVPSGRHFYAIYTAASGPEAVSPVQIKGKQYFDFAINAPEDASCPVINGRPVNAVDAALATGNLIANGDFEQISAELPGSDFIFSEDGNYCFGCYGYAAGPVTRYALPASELKPGIDAPVDGHCIVIAPSVNTAAIYKQSIQVKPFTHYIFRVWAKNAARNETPAAHANPVISMLINESDAIEPVNVGAYQQSPAEGWVEIAASWYSGAESTVTLQLRNLQADPNANDLALDNLFFGEYHSAAAAAQAIKDAKASR